MQNPPVGPDAAEAVRHARFGELPGRIRPKTVEERKATAPNPVRDTYKVHEWLARHCL